ncbi:MAG: hypothetical protein HC767_05770 [Akkermansiaceae bacterium]|nr:hypothetical protein [Akkermansiaceae bacterium]
MVDGRWSFDWEALESAVTPETKVFLLCNPQNPLGRVFLPVRSSSWRSFVKSTLSFLFRMNPLRLDF